MGRLAVIAAVVTGCSFSPRNGPDDMRKDGKPIDGRPDARVYRDAMLDAPPGCDGAAGYIVCLSTVPMSSVTLGAQTIDTAACTYNGGTPGQMYDPGKGEPHFCVIPGKGVTIDGAVRGEGP